MTEAELELHRQESAFRSPSMINATVEGAMLIVQERKRQLVRKGYTPEHDDAHQLGELSQAATAYAEVASSQIRGASAEEFPADMMIAEGDWPWEEDSWKPSPNPIRNLIKAGALIAAEIDRLLRIAKTKESTHD